MNWQPFIGWGLTTIALRYLNKRSKSEADSSTPADLNVTESATKIGNPIPVVLGRGMIKSPLISYYGDFESKIYTEEYSAHSNFDAKSLVFSLILTFIASAITGHQVTPGTVTTTGANSAGTVNGTGESTGATYKDDLTGPLLNALFMWLLGWLINKRNLKTTIQKGFKYYLGWQFIVCWTGNNIGIKNIYMSKYNSGTNSSKEASVFTTSSNKISDPNGIVAKVDDPDLFGGVDEGGGFIGEFRIYFGSETQTKDSWMVEQMSKDSIQSAVKGLTPIYKRLTTAVVPKAYIGKNSSIPEVWLEVQNYPDSLGLGRIRDDLNPAEMLYELHINKDWGLGETDESIDKDSLINLGKRLKTPKTAEAKIVYDDEDILKITGADGGTRYNGYEISIEGPKFGGGDDTYDIDDKKITIYCQRNEDDEIVSTPKFINDLINGTYELSRLIHCQIIKNVDSIIIPTTLVLAGGEDGEDFGISMNISTTQTAEEAINQIMDTIGAVKYTDTATGKLTFKLIREDYDLKGIPIINETNCISCEVTRLDWTETVSSITVSFTDADSLYETSTVPEVDPANTLITNAVTNKTYSFPLITRADLAVRVAKREQVTNGYPLATCTIQVNRSMSYLNIGEVFNLKMPAYGIESMVMRVNDIDKGELTDGVIQLSAIEDVFGFASQKFSDNNGSGWEEIIQNPTGVSFYKYLELPYELSESRDTFVSALAARPTTITTVWKIWRKKINDAEFVPTNETSMWSAIGEIRTNIPEYQPNYFLRTNMTDPIPECITDTVFEVREMGNGNMISKIVRNYDYLDPSNYEYSMDLYGFTTLIMVDEEIMLCRGISVMPNGNYRIYSVVRGVCDTVPQRHSTFSLCYFLNKEFMRNVTGLTYVVGKGFRTTEKYNITTASINAVEDFDEAKVTELETIDRANRPRPPMNVKLKPFPSSNSLVQSKELVSLGLTGVGVDDPTVHEDYALYRPYLDVTDFGYTGGFYDGVGRVSAYGFVLLIEAQNKFNETYIRQPNQSLAEGNQYVIKMSVGDSVRNKTMVKENSNLKDVLVDLDVFSFLSNPTKITDDLLLNEDNSETNYPLDTYQAFGYSWEKRCSDFPDNLALPVDMQIFVNDPSTDMSMYHYSKSIMMECPTVVNVFSEGDLQDGRVLEYIEEYGTEDHIFLPQGDFSSTEILTKYEDCPIIVLGNRVTNFEPGAIIDAEGDYWIPTKFIYFYKSIDLNAVRTDLFIRSITEGYVFRSYFNPDSTKTAIYYRNNNNVMSIIGDRLP